MFSKVLVANRAEIAVRVVRTCRELGVTSVAVHSDPDADALHVRLADETVSLGGTSAGESYLDIDKIITAALDTGAEAIHPGYGFLAENAGFARRVREAGLVWIGPPAEAIEVMGEKVAARAVATKAGVPQVPGTSAITTPGEVLAFGEDYGYPIAIKASYGGGGRGMRTVASPDEVPHALEAARREALGAFGRDDVYLERYLERARHVEVQVFADQHGNVVYLGDRDCSVQRRHQKVVEEAPAPGLSAELRAAMGEASVNLAKAVDYVGAGTIEFLVEADREAFYFLEMNTRIQVEHPVTEATLGLDLIVEQLRVASGEPLSVLTSGPAPRGHAIEIRLNAEDVSGGAFRPSPGPIRRLEFPTRPGVRFDSGYEPGDEVQPYYDSLIGKLIVWAPTREQAIDRTLETIAQSHVEGVPTTLPAATAVLSHPDFRAGRMTTRWLENDIDIATLLPEVPSHMAHEDDETGDDRQVVYVFGREYRIPLPLAASSAAALPSAGSKNAGRAGGGGGGKARGAGRPRKAASGSVTSPMQGTVVKIGVSVGQTVAEGDILLVLEAMKMENPVKAPVDGVVTEISATEGVVVSAGTSLLTITPATSNETTETPA
jgi:acetyl-CoA/propionyl-CoA carboxylase biotin carboxyl carrier protein